MKIIKPGRDQKGWAKEYECTGNGNGNGDGGCLSRRTIDTKETVEYGGFLWRRI